MRHSSVWRVTRVFGALIIFQLVGTLLVVVSEWWHRSHTTGHVGGKLIEVYRDVERDRAALVSRLVGSLFNNSEFLFFLTAEQSIRVSGCTT